MTISQQDKSRNEALAFLHDRGAHLVLCDGKKPIWAQWQKRRPRLDVVLHHGDDIGLVPYSLKTSALDIDTGDVGELIAEHVPLTTLASPRGRHCYFPDSEPRANSRWQWRDNAGDVRSAKGFLRLYPGGPEKLADALARGGDWADSFPADLFAAAGVDAPLEAKTGKPQVYKTKVPKNLTPLEQAHVGIRNNTLFDHTRFWAYLTPKPATLDEWKEDVFVQAMSFNTRIPLLLGEAEVAKLAWSVTSWTWSGGGPLDHSPMAQRRRAVKRWHGDAKPETLAFIEARDAAILDMIRDGHSQVATARFFKLARCAVQNVIARDGRQGELDLGGAYT